MSIVARLEENFKDIIQHDIELESIKTGKFLRKGKFILYTIKDFYMTIVLINHKGETKYYNMPVPYDNKLHKDRLTLDYTLPTFSSESPKVMEIVELLGESKSPFYDNVIEMRIVTPSVLEDL